MSPTVSAVIALLSILVTGGGVWLQYRNTRRQNQTNAHLAAVEDRKVDQEAYDHAVQYYEGIVSQLQTQVDSCYAKIKALNEQLDLVYGQLAQERNVSNTLRIDVWGLQDKVRELQKTIDVLQGTIEDLKHTREDLDPV